MKSMECLHNQTKVTRESAEVKGANIKNDIHARPLLSRPSKWSLGRDTTIMSHSVQQARFARGQDVLEKIWGKGKFFGWFAKTRAGFWPNMAKSSIKKYVFIKKVKYVFQKISSFHFLIILALWDPRKNFWSGTKWRWTCTGRWFSGLDVSSGALRAQIFRGAAVRSAAKRSTLRAGAQRGRKSFDSIFKS